MKYNLMEKAYIHGATLFGAIAPVLGTRYVVFGKVEVKDWTDELVAWGGVLLLNIFPPFPIIYSFVGKTLGTIAARFSQESRRYSKKNSLDKYWNSLESPTLLQQGCGVLNPINNKKNNLEDLAKAE